MTMHRSIKAVDGAGFFFRSSACILCVRSRPWAQMGSIINEGTGLGKNRGKRLEELKDTSANVRPKVDNVLLTTWKRRNEGQTVSVKLPVLWCRVDGPIWGMCCVHLKCGLEGCPLGGAGSRSTRGTRPDVRRTSSSVTAE